MNNYLIAANSKRSMLIFSMFRWIDLIILGSGGIVTLILFITIQPDRLLPVIIVLLPLAVCAFLVIPVVNYHNILCILQNIITFYFKEPRQYIWKGWRFKDEYK